MYEKKILRKLYDLDNNWIGIEVVEHITKTKAELLYPETFNKIRKEDY